MFFKRDKYKKLKREEVVESICELENRERKLEDEITQKSEQINELIEKGKKETSRDIQLLLAKKIMFLKDEKETDIKHCMYLMYNIKMAKRLKNAIDDNQFILNTGKVSITDLLSDQKGLAKFLNKALQTKVSDEEVLTSADEIFNEVQGSYVENKSIYGVQEDDDELLAVFETAKTISEDLEAATANQESSDSSETQEEAGKQ